MNFFPCKMLYKIFIYLILISIYIILKISNVLYLLLNIKLLNIKLHISMPNHFTSITICYIPRYISYLIYVTIQSLFLISIWYKQIPSEILVSYKCNFYRIYPIIGERFIACIWLSNGKVRKKVSTKSLYRKFTKYVTFETFLRT